MSDRAINKAMLFNNLEQISQLEKQIESAGLTTIKPLAKRLATLTRKTLAILAVEVFDHG